MVDPGSVLALGIMLLAAAWGVVTAKRIQAYLWSHGRMVSLVLLRPTMVEELRDYGRITRAELGRPGPLFVHSVIAWLLTTVSATAALAMATLT
jgi:hypothetical protein